MFPEPLPLFSIETGTSGSFDLPIATAKDPEGDSITSRVKLPLDASFITFDSSTNKLWVNGPKALANQATGSYKYTIELIDGKGAIAEFSSSIEFTPTDKLLPQLPLLAYTSVVDPVIIPAGLNKRIYLPDYVGLEPIQENVDFSKTTLLDYNSEQRIINLIGRKNKADQALEVILTLADDLGQVVSQKIIIKILQVQYTAGQSDETDEDFRSIQATITSIDAAGKVDITFSEQVVSYEDDSLEQITKALVVEGYRFDEATQDFTIEVPFEYECIKLADKTLQIQLYFKEPIEVSAQSIQDRLFVSFVNETFFQSSLDFTMIEPEYTVSSTIPPQFASLDSARSVMRATKVANGGSYLIMVGLIVGQMAGKSVIKRIWSLFMALQIAVLVLDFETLVVPATCEQILKSIKGVLTIDALDPVKLMQKVKPTLASKLRDSNSFFGNVNPLVLGAIAVIAGSALVAAGHFIVRKALKSQDSRVKKVVEYLKSVLMYNSIIVSLQTSYLQLWITTARLLKHNINGYILYQHAQATPAAQRVLQKAEIAVEEPKSLKSLVMDTIQVFVFTVGLTFVIVKVAMVIERNNKYYFRRTNVKERIGALYSNLETTPKAKLHFATFFFVRRLLVAAILIFGQTSFIKVELIGIIGFAAIYYSIVYSPFVDPFDDKIEILNETCILICNYWQMEFSDLLWDSPQLRSNLSYFFIFIILLMIAINLYFMIKCTIYQYLKTLIIKWMRKQQLQANVEIQANQQPEDEAPQEPLPQAANPPSQDVSQVMAGTQMMPIADIELVESELAEAREYPIPNLLPGSNHVSRNKAYREDYTRDIGLERVDQVYVSSDEENKNAQRIIKKEVEEEGEDEVFISSDEDYHRGERIVKQAALGSGIEDEIEDLYNVVSNLEQIQQPAPFLATWSNQQSDQPIDREVQLAGNVPENPQVTKQFLSPDFVQNIATVIDTSARTPEVTGAKIPTAATRLAIFPDQPHQLRQGESQWSTQHKCQLQYVMPQSDKWVRKAYACSQFVIPDFTSHDSKARREMILKECDLHWLTPDQSGQVADRFEAVFLDPASLSTTRQLDKQVIWIVAALNQRYVEQVHEQKNQANQRWTETLKQRETIKAKLKSEWEQKKSLNQPKTLPDLSPYLSQAQQRPRFIAECKAQYMSESQTSLLLQRWNEMRPGHPLRTERDLYVGQILATIINDHIINAADDGYAKELAQLEQTWQQEDIAIFEELSRLQDIIKYYQY